MYVFVLSVNGQPVMPCKPRKARILLRNGLAKVVKRTPFTIQLNHRTKEYVQDISLGVDSGYKHIGVSATTTKYELFAGQVELRTDIVKLLSARRESRRSRRNRKTRYRQPRFNNRVASKRQGWLAPSVEHKVQTHLTVIDRLRKILPIKKIVVETAAFNIQLLKNPEISGVQYQQGDQLSFWNTREYVLFRDNHTCRNPKCSHKDAILNVHHIESRQTGGDRPDNLITLCNSCHKDFHKGKIQIELKKQKGFRAEAFMGIMRWTFFNRLKEQYPNLDICNTYGYLTKNKRIRYNLQKDHAVDAYCIADNLLAKRTEDFFFIEKKRCHNRKLFKDKIKKGGIRQRNQSVYEVKGFRLFDKVLFEGKEWFIWGKRTSGSFVLKSVDGCKREVVFKKLQLLEKAKHYLIARRYA